MTFTYQFRQISLLLSGLTYPLMFLFLPMAGGGASLIAVFFAPITFSASIIMMLIQKVMNVFSKNEAGKIVLYFLFMILVLTFTFMTFPYR